MIIKIPHWMQYNNGWIWYRKILVSRPNTRYHEHYLTILTKTFMWKSNV